MIVPSTGTGIQCTTVGTYEPNTLGFVIDDYVLHMQHHIDHLLAREVVTKYPR